MDGVKAVRAGSAHNLILKMDNSLWVTGDNSLGELGDGTNVNKKTPSTKREVHSRINT